MVTAMARAPHQQHLALRRTRRRGRAHGQGGALPSEAPSTLGELRDLGAGDED